MILFEPEEERIAVEAVIAECHDAGEDVLIADVMRRYPVLKKLKKNRFYEIYDYIVGELNNGPESQKGDR